MPARPLFHTTRTQHASVAALMLLLLAGSLAAAHMLSESRVVPRHSITVLERLRIEIPDGWTQNPARSAALQLPNAMVFEDGQRPRRYIVVFALPLEEPLAPHQALILARGIILTEAQRESLRGMAPIIQTDTPGPSALYFGVSQTQPTDLPEQHMMAVMTTTGQHYWVAYLRDQTLPGENFRLQLEQNANLLRMLHQSMTPRREG